MKGKMIYFLAVPLILLCVGSGVLLLVLAFWPGPVSNAPKKEAAAGEMTKVEAKDDPYFYVEEDMELLNAYKDYNPDVVGLIRIPDTVLNHPLMQTPEDEDFYLLHDLDGNYNSHGIPLLSKDSDLEHGDNVIIYGHNIHKNTRDVFADLAGYEELSFYQEHPIVETVSEQGTCRWLIVAYFITDNGEKGAFRYSDVTDFPTLSKFEEFFSEVEKRNWLDVPYEYGIDDRFLTLSSCSNELAGTGTNRMVVIACQLGAHEEYEGVVGAAAMRENPLLPRKLQ